MPGLIGSGGNHKEMLGGSGGTGTAIGVSGAYKSIRGMWIGSGGVWKQWFVALQLKLTSIDVIGVNNNSGGFEAKRDGVLRLGLDSPTGWDARADEWVEFGRAADVGDGLEIRLTKSSGSDPTSGPALNTWHALSSDRRWEWAGDPIVFEGTATIRDIATSGSDHQVSAAVSIDVSKL